MCLFAHDMHVIYVKPAFDSRKRSFLILVKLQRELRGVCLIVEGFMGLGCGS